MYEREREEELDRDPQEEMDEAKIGLIEALEVFDYEISKNRGEIERLRSEIAARGDTEALGPFVLHRRREIRGLLQRIATLEQQRNDALAQSEHDEG